MFSIVDQSAGYALGTLLGMRHALEPDHLAAVSVMFAESSPDRGRAARRFATLGALWGLGHSVTLFATATLLTVARTQLPEWSNSLFEAAASLALVVMGLRALIVSIKEHRGAEAPSLFARGQALSITSVFTGMIHGLAGSGTLIAIAAAQQPTTVQRLQFIGLFGVGSTLAMAILSGSCGATLANLLRRRRSVRILGVLAGIWSFVIGLRFCETFLRAE